MAKIEQRILIGKLLDIDITGKPLGELKAMLSDNPKKEKLEPVYESVTKILHSETPEERVSNALIQVLDDSVSEDADAKTTKATDKVAT